MTASFAVTRASEAKRAALVPSERPAKSNLVDYAIFIAEEALEIRATHLLGAGHLAPTFAGSALENLLEDPTCDDALQFIVKLLFAHHWFFPYAIARLAESAMRERTEPGA
jgi:hypothetical protein